MAEEEEPMEENEVEFEERRDENVNVGRRRDRSRTRWRMDELEERLAHMEAMMTDLRYQVEELREENGRLGDDLILLKRTAATGGGTTPSQPQAKIKVKEPGTFDGSRNDKLLDNFLWDMEEYLLSIPGIDEEMKVRTAARYLVGSAKLWWRTRAEDKAAGKQVVEVDSWEQLKEALKHQFRPENSAWLARGKLRKLKQTGKMSEYVKIFSSLMLEIKDMSEEDRLYSFTEGLCNYAKNELRRKEVRTVAEAIREAERLQDYSNDGERTMPVRKPQPYRPPPLSGARGPPPQSGPRRTYGSYGNSGARPNNGPYPSSGSHFKPRSGEGSAGSTARKSPPRTGGPRPNSTFKCFTCGGANHISRDCPHQHHSLPCH